LPNKRLDGRLLFRSRQFADYFEKDDRLLLLRKRVHQRLVQGWRVLQHQGLDHRLHRMLCRRRL
jgi:hypothetical protein